MAKCKGIFFRAYCSTYSTKNGIARKVELKQLKRMSCPGCSECEWFFDDFKEVNEDMNHIKFNHVEDQKIYTPVVKNESRDFETGYVDEYDIYMQEVKK